MLSLPYVVQMDEHSAWWFVEVLANPPTCPVPRQLLELFAGLEPVVIPSQRARYRALLNAWCVHCKRWCSPAPPRPASVC
jgi:hypothetical protein